MTHRRDLVVAVAQPSTTTHDLAGNASRHADLVRRSGARVVGFPELSLTGYDMTVAPVDPADERLGTLVQACAQTGAVAFAGAPVAAAGGGRHIAVLRVDGTGVRVAYRKRFLGGAEPDAFIPGHEPAVVEVDGWRIGLAICRDTGIARHDRDLAAIGMDLYLAGVVEHAANRAVPGERARRIATGHGSGWPSPPAPAAPAAATTTPPAVPRSGNPTAPSPRPPAPIRTRWSRQR